MSWRKIHRQTKKILHREASQTRAKIIHTTISGIRAISETAIRHEIKVRHTRETMARATTPITLIGTMVVGNSGVTETTGDMGMDHETLTQETTMAVINSTKINREML
jgi:hypothetical protein